MINAQRARQDADDAQHRAEQAREDCLAAQRRADDHKAETDERIERGVDRDGLDEAAARPAH